MGIKGNKQNFRNSHAWSVFIFTAINICLQVYIDFVRIYLVNRIDNYIFFSSYIYNIYKQGQEKLSQQ